MITLSELYPIGYVSKTHGINGELNVQLDTDYNPEDFRFLVFEIDSTYIPFEVGNSRGQGLQTVLSALSMLILLRKHAALSVKLSISLNANCPTMLSTMTKDFT